MATTISANRGVFNLNNATLSPVTIVTGVTVAGVSAVPHNVVRKRKEPAVRISFLPGTEVIERDQHAEPRDHAQ